jgi:hypothetical protein
MPARPCLQILFSKTNHHDWNHLHWPDWCPPRVKVGGGGRAPGKCRRCYALTCSGTAHVPPIPITCTALAPSVMGRAGGAFSGLRDTHAAARVCPGTRYVCSSGATQHSVHSWMPPSPRRTWARGARPLTPSAASLPSKRWRSCGCCSRCMMRRGRDAAAAAYPLHGAACAAAYVQPHGRNSTRRVPYRSESGVEWQRGVFATHSRNWNRGLRCLRSAGNTHSSFNRFEQTCARTTVALAWPAQHPRFSQWYLPA